MRTALEMFNRERAQLGNKTQADQAEWLGIKPAYMSDLVNGRRRLTAKVLAKFSRGKQILLQQAREEAEAEWVAACK